jgi:hypothetical protein
VAYPKFRKKRQAEANGAPEQPGISEQIVDAAVSTSDPETGK